MKKTKRVLDSYAVLAFLNGEIGCERVRVLLADAQQTGINLLPVLGEDRLVIRVLLESRDQAESLLHKHPGLGSGLGIFMNTLYRPEFMNIQQGIPAGNTDPQAVIQHHMKIGL